MQQLATALATLSHARIDQLASAIGVRTDDRGRSTRAQRCTELVRHPEFVAIEALRSMTRDELQAAAAELGCSVDSPARVDYIDALLRAVGADVESEAVRLQRHREALRQRAERGELPSIDDEVRARQGTWLVLDVVEGGVRASGERELTRVDLVNLDDDRRGQRLSVLWELELGASVLNRAEHSRHEVEGFDTPSVFAAWLDALRWQGVSARDGKLLQAPFRAGIKEMQLQMVPLLRALELPRANLFIADDVGLGKTIEAGLIMQELRLRQRVDSVLIVAPPALCTQWQVEMRERFGVEFRIYNRDFIRSVQRRFGFQVNPFKTFDNFIISYHMLRRAEHLERLRAHIGTRLGRSLLVLDEAHTVAPATSNAYALDSHTTRAVREIAPVYENRLFLSATPHNGHSNSFSALLEMLDPQRFTRGVPIDADARESLEQVMVRRLKSDLEGKAGAFDFPRRNVVSAELTHRDGVWYAPFDGEDVALGRQPAFEIDLADRFREYMKHGRGANVPPMVFSTLQKRLLSGVAAFAQTFRKHVKSAAQNAPAIAGQQIALAEDVEAWDQEIDQIDAHNVQLGSDVVRSHRVMTELQQPIVELASRYRERPDGRVLYLFEWMRRNMCPAIDRGGEHDDGAPLKPKERKWNSRRLIIFTEYRDTLSYLHRMLSGALRETDDAGNRVAVIDGSTPSDERDEIRHAFNQPPGDEPLRVLLATDAAREGLNLQTYCHDIFHFDLPWNPARLEQRNGRIDRNMQPEPDVYCRHFIYTQRQEDVVLDTLVHKIEVIRRELGSLGAVLFDELSRKLESGIDGISSDDLEAVGDTDRGEGKLNEKLGTVKVELEQARADINKAIASAGRALGQSRKYAGINADRLRDVVNTALGLMGLPALEPQTYSLARGRGTVDVQVFRLPDGFPAEWRQTLDQLRKPRGADEDYWEFRGRPPRPVCFDAPPVLTSEIVHLHLEHPFVKRLLAAFRATAFAESRLNGASVVRMPKHDTPSLVVYGRVTLFGAGARRVHDEVLAVESAFELDAGVELEAKLVSRERMDLIAGVARQGDSIDDVLPNALRDRLLAQLPALVGSCWDWLEAESDATIRQVEQDLTERAGKEAEALRDILLRQRQAIEKQLGKQLDIFGELTADEERQFRNDRKHMQNRLAAIEGEMETEPQQLRDLYKVNATRVEPVGVMILWPEAR